MLSSGEFDLIARYFGRAAGSRGDVVAGIGDDCALLNVPQGQTLAVSTDTLVEGIHFFPDIDPADLACKAMAVNLSDMAAMGAEPAWLTLAMTLPYPDKGWLQAFSDALFTQLTRYGIQLIGGDTTRGPRSLTLGIHGFVPHGKALRRCGARPGEWIYVTGNLGDSAAGLALLRKQLEIDDPLLRNALIQRHLRPLPRIPQGIALRDIASSAIDISDGLLADLNHILKASGCGALIDLDKLPLMTSLYRYVDPPQMRNWALAGGEDYELCFTVAENQRNALERLFAPSDVSCTCIGQTTPVSEGVMLMEQGHVVTISMKGFDHFDV